MLTIGSVVIRVRDLASQSRFWCSALDYLVRHPTADDFAVLRPRDGAGPNVSLDAQRSERVLPPRIHLDLYAEEVAWTGRPPDADYVIVQDPEGNRFCVVDASR